MFAHGSNSRGGCGGFMLDTDFETASLRRSRLDVSRPLSCNFLAMSLTGSGGMLRIFLFLSDRSRLYWRSASSTISLGTRERRLVNSSIVWGVGKRTKPESAVDRSPFYSKSYAVLPAGNRTSNSASTFLARRSVSISITLSYRNLKELAKRVDAYSKQFIHQGLLAGLRAQDWFRTVSHSSNAAASRRRLPFVDASCLNISIVDLKLAP